MFSHLIYSVKKFYKFYTLSAICKYDAAINCITGEHRKGSFPSSCAGRTTLITVLNTQVAKKRVAFVQQDKKSCCWLKQWPLLLARSA
jgi:hypothetical protein